MALNSISRLAIHIVSDVTKLLPGFQRAQHETRQLGEVTQGTNSKLFTLGRQAILSTGALGRFGSLTAGLGGAIAGPLGLAAAAAAAATVGVGKFALSLARAADAARDFRITVEREFFQAFNALHSTNFSNDLLTTTEQMERLKEQFSEIAQASGLSQGPLLTFANTMATIFKQGLVGVGIVRQLDLTNIEQATQRTKKLAEETKRLKEIQKTKDTDLSQFMRDFDSLGESMKSRGKQLEESLRTPIERLRDSLVELEQLRAGGAIGDETLARGLKQAADAYHKAITEAKGAGPLRTTGAAERGTTAGFASMIRGQLQVQADAEMKRIEQQQLEAIRQVRAAIQNQKPQPLKVANLAP